MSAIMPKLNRLTVARREIMMTRVINLLFCIAMFIGLTACGGGGGSAGTPGGSANPNNFRVNAPGAVELAVGQKAIYDISGGLSPYLVNNSAPNIVAAVIAGNVLEVTPLRTGSAVLSVSPSGIGATAQTINVTVSSSANPLQVQMPDSVVIQLGNTVSYAVSGGAAPYAAESSARGIVEATVVGDRLQLTARGVGSASVSVFDRSGSGTVQKAVSVVTTSAFFSTAPSTISMGNGTQRTFTVGGGVAPYYVSSSNSAVADASLSGGVLTVLAGSTNGTAVILLRDSGGSQVSIAATVGTNVSFFTDAPEAMTIQAGSPRSFSLGGGKKPYRVSSSNTAVVTAVMSGDSGFTLTAVGRGTATVRLTDDNNASLSVVVSVEQGSSVAVSAIELTSSLVNIRSAGEEALITALVKGANNVGIANADVAFTADTGILLAPDAQTNASGIATVRLAPGSNKANRDITVTARVGALAQTIVVGVRNSTIAVTGSSALPVGGSASPYTARALDSGGNPIAGVTLTASSLLLNNGVSPSTAVTDSNGYATFNYTPTNSGSDTLRVRSAVGSINTDGSLSISISPVSFDFLTPPTPVAGANFGVNLAPASQPAFTVRLSINGVPTAGRAVTFNSTRGTLSAVTDLGGGDYRVTLNSASAGSALVTAQVARLPGDPGSGTLLGSVSREIAFTGIVPAAVRVQANPTSIPPNGAGSESNRSAIAATVTDASGNPVAGRQVTFNVTADPSNGKLIPGVALTDASGIARSEYISGLNSSPTNGVVIQASVPPVNADIPAALVTDGTGPNSPAARLTVAGNALFITIGLSNTIGNVDPSTYRKPFSVYVTDASGLAVPNQVVTLSAIPTLFRKGRLAFNTPVWTYESTAQGAAAVPPRPGSPVASCPSEDQFFADGRRNNGILDPGEDGGPAGVGINPNGNGNGALTPGNVVIASPATVTTNSAGIATFDLLYGEQYALWVDVDVIATASVSGTESRTVLPFGLVGVASDFNDEAVAPAARFSPFGTSQTGLNFATPRALDGTLSACTNPN